MNAPAWPRRLPCDCYERVEPGKCSGFHQNYTSDMCADHRAAHLAKCEADSAHLRAGQAANRAAYGIDHFDAGTSGANELHRATGGATYPATF